MKLNDEQVNEIVDSDPKAEAAMRRLLDQFNAGVIGHERFARLRHNIRGNAITRWMRERTTELQSN